MHQWLPSSAQQVLQPSHEIVPQHVRPGGAQWPSQQSQSGAQLLVIWEPTHTPSAPTRPEVAAVVVVAFVSARLEASVAPGLFASAASRPTMPERCARARSAGPSGEGFARGRGLSGVDERDQPSPPGPSSVSSDRNWSTDLQQVPAKAQSSRLRIHLFKIEVLKSDTYNISHEQHSQARQPA